MTDWRLDAEHTFPNDLARMLGEDEDGILYTPIGGTPAEPEAWVPFKWWHPRHWRPYINSRSARRLVALESHR